MTEQPGPPNGTRHLCPLETTCSWSFIAPPAPIVGEQALADIFGPGTMKLQATNEHLAAIELALTEHIVTHSPIEFVTEIAKLRELSIGLAKQLAEMGQLYRTATPPPATPDRPTPTTNAERLRLAAAMLRLRGEPGDDFTARMAELCEPIAIYWAEPYAAPFVPMLEASLRLADALGIPPLARTATTP